LKGESTCGRAADQRRRCGRRRRRRRVRRRPVVRVRPPAGGCRRSRSPPTARG